MVGTARRAPLPTIRIQFSSGVVGARSFAISPREPREFYLNFTPPEHQRAQGMPGARCARSRACSVVNTRVSHHGHTGITRHSPRNGFNGCFVLSPVTGLS